MVNQKGKDGRCEVVWYLNRNPNDNSSITFTCKLLEDDENYCLEIPEEFSQLLDLYYKKKKIKLKEVYVKCS